MGLHLTLDVAEALLAGGLLRREQIPPLAVQILAEGHDTETVRRLAGLVGDELSEAHALFERMLAELGRQPLPVEAAATRLARHLAQAALMPGSSLQEVAYAGAELAIAFGYAGPLSAFYNANDSYDLEDIIPRKDTDRRLLDSCRELLSDP